MSDVLSPEQRSYCMSRIRGKDTKPELALRKALWNLGFRYRVNYNLIGKPDIVFPGKHIAVFVDGCFWHYCPIHCKIPLTNKEFWEDKLKKNAERDKEISLKLKKQGWKVIRLWEHQIKENLSISVDEVIKVLDR